MTRQLLIAHPTGLSGENHGLYIQHVASMQWLMQGVDEWNVVALDFLHPAFAEAAISSDLLVLHMLSSREIEAVIRLRRERGLPTLMELSDNFLALGSWLPKKHALRSPLVRQSILYHASIADGLQLYSRGLAELFSHVNPTLVLLDPYVPIRPQTARKARASQFIFGWGGTTSHAADLEAIAPAIVAFCRRHPEAMFAFMGNRTIFEKWFAGIPASQACVHDFDRYEVYLDFVSALDLGLAPLNASGFNAARTDTKFATYAACGVAALVQESEVFDAHRGRARFFASPDDFELELESLFADREGLAALGAVAHQWAMRERGAERLRAQRLTQYVPLLPPRRETAVVAPGPSPPEHRRLSEFVGKESAPSIVELEGIVREHPQYTQARLTLARAYEQREDYAAAYELLEAVPHHAIYHDVISEKLAGLARHVRPHDMARHTAQIRSPVARVRIDHQGLGRREYLDALLEVQPYDYLALATTIPELIRTRPDAPELPLLCLRASLVAPEIVPAQYRPSNLARFLAP